MKLKLTLISLFVYTLCLSQKINTKLFVEKIINHLFPKKEQCVLVADTSFKGVEVETFFKKSLDEAKSNNFSAIKNKINYYKLDSVFLINKENRFLLDKMKRDSCNQIWVLVFTKYIISNKILSSCFTKMSSQNCGVTYCVEYDIDKNKLLMIEQL